jgi:small subunit ribosomal protein S35
MPSAASSLRLAARRCQQCRVSRPAAAPASLIRTFASSASRFEGEPTKESKEVSAQSAAAVSAPALSPEEAAAAKLEETIAALRAGTLAEQSAKVISSRMSQSVRRRRPIEMPVKYQTQGFMNMGEAPADSEEDPDFEEDDIPSIAHGQLEQHREYREYARLAAWEMPLLSSMFSYLRITRMGREGWD